MISKSSFVLVTAVLALACASCGNKQSENNCTRQIENNFNKRCANLRKTVGWIVESEERRPEELQKTARVIDEQINHDIQKTFVDNPATMKKWWDEEFHRWEVRQPLYLKTIGDELDGNLDSLERTIPYIID